MNGVRRGQELKLQGSMQVKAHSTHVSNSNVYKQPATMGARSSHVGGCREAVLCKRLSSLAHYGTELRGWIILNRCMDTNPAILAMQGC
jgi:hypothetical protein